MRKRFGCFAVITGMFLPMFLANSAARAQTTRGAITGAVSDESGALVIGAKITVTQIDTGYTHATDTDAQGNYVVPGLLPGRYRVEGELKGFQKTVIEPLQLHVDERLTVDIVLKVGTVTQEVKVTSQGEIVQLASASLGQLVQNRMVEELPLNGRNFLQLGLLSPGATTAPQGSDQTGFNEPTINISGGRAGGNQFSIDGVFDDQIHFNGLNLVLSVDAIQEFKVQRNTFSAEFGYGTAQINVASRQGSNEFHGTVYEFLRNDSLDARQFFDAKIPPFRQNQFGGSIGGPIRKEKTFFFANYEGFRESQGNTVIGTLPSAQLLSGNFAGLPPIHDPQTGKPFPGNQILSSSFSNLTKRLLPFLPQIPTSGAKNYTATPKLAQQFDQFTVRVDHRISDKDIVFGRVSSEPRLHFFIPGLIPKTGNNFSDAPVNSTFQWTHSFSPALLNEVHLGFNRDLQSRLQEGAGTSDILQFKNITGAAASPLNFGFPTLNISGFSGFGTTPNIPEIVGGNTFQYDDNLTWIHGRHSLKFGGGYRDQQFPHIPFVFSRGIFVFAGTATGNPVADFLLGNPFVMLGDGTGASGFITMPQFDWYVQDDWKIRPHLTLNLGLRYERSAVLSDRYRGRLGVFDEKTGQIVRGSQDEERLGLINPDNNDFGPRFGFAWQPFNDNRTVVRGGFGIYYDVNPINEKNFGLGTDLPFQQIVDVNPLLGKPPSVNWDNLWPAGPGALNLGIFSNDPRARDPYLGEWSLGVQRELPFDTVIETTYVGSFGRKLNGRVSPNQATLPAFPGQPLAPRLPYPGIGPILMAKDISISDYNALQVRVDKRFSHNLTFLVAYTYGKSLDTTSSSADIGSNFPQNGHNIRGGEYGLSSFDQRQRFSLSTVYLLPFGSGLRYLSTASGPLDKLVKGWQFNAIITLASGTPFPIQESGVDRTQTGVFGGGIQRANCVGPTYGNLPNGRTVQEDFNISAFPKADFGTFGNCGRDTVISRGINNWDLSLFKNTSLAEKLTVQFRAEFFNTWNHAQFGIPINDPTNAAFGQILSVRPARQIQLALKLLF